MAAFWPTVGDDDPFAKHLNHVTKYVASRNMTEATWEDTTVLNGDVAEQVREIKERDGGTISVLGFCRMDTHSLSRTRRRPAWHVRSIS